MGLAMSGPKSADYYLTAELRRQLAEKDKEIQHLKDLLDNMAEETQDDKTEILHKIIQTKVDPFLALIQLSNIDKLREQAKQIRCEYEPFVEWEKDNE